MAKKVLIIRSGALGDTIFASSILSVLEKEFGSNTKIYWAGKSWVMDIFVEDLRIIKTYKLSHNSLPIIFNKSKLVVILASWLRPFDMVVNLETSTKFFGLMRLLRASKKIGAPYEVITSIKNEHAVDSLKRVYQNFAHSSAIKFAVPQIKLAKEERILQQLGLEGKKYIVVHVGNSHIKRNRVNLRSWPTKNWKSLLMALSENKNYKIVVIGSNEERVLIDQIIEKTNENIISIAGKTSTLTLAHVIKTADLLISTDSGPSHMAAALNTPVIALLGPTIPSKTGPYQTGENKVVIMRSAIECSPCVLSESYEKCENNLCMQSIDPSLILDNVSKILANE